jgi:hypothetical protein
MKTTKKLFFRLPDAFRFVDELGRNEFDIGVISLQPKQQNSIKEKK